MELGRVAITTGPSLEASMSEEVREQDIQVHTNEDSALPGVTLTPKALEAEKKLHAKEELGGEHGLSSAVLAVRCPGFQYSLGFDVTKNSDIITDTDAAI